MKSLYIGLMALLCSSCMQLQYDADDYKQSFRIAMDGVTNIEHEEHHSFIAAELADFIVGHLEFKNIYLNKDNKLNKYLKPALMRKGLSMVSHVNMGDGTVEAQLLHKDQSFYLVAYVNDYIISREYRLKDFKLQAHGPFSLVSRRLNAQG